MRALNTIALTVALITTFLLIACSADGERPAVARFSNTSGPADLETTVAARFSGAELTGSHPDVELKAIFTDLLAQPLTYVTSRYHRTTYLPMWRTGAEKPVPFVFGNGRVTSRGYFSAPESFQLTQTVDPIGPIVLPDGSDATVEGSEWSVAIKDGAIVSSASSGLASSLPDANSGDLLAQFFSISLTGVPFEGGMDEFLTFESLHYVPSLPEEVGADKVIEAQRGTITGDVEIWRFTIDRNTQLRMVSLEVRRPLVSSDVRHAMHMQPATLTVVGSLPGGSSSEGR